MKKRRALFIGIGFYDYDKSIIDEFNLLGYDVDYYSEVPKGIIYRFYCKYNRVDNIQMIINRTSMNIARNCSSDYDLVFVIKGEYLTQESIDYIKFKNPKSEWILYLWDSIARIPKSQGTFKNFNKIYSFDRLDCINNENLIFNPLFYRKEYSQELKNREEEYGIYFLGWYHSDRLKLVNKIVKFCKENDIRYKLVLYTGYINYLIHLVTGGELKNNRKNLIFKSISAKMNVSFILKSKSTLDIAHHLQSGLTMRTIELLGARKKIVTTNKDIINYDFYHPSNILIIDRENPTFENDFFKGDYVPISNEIIEQYSIGNWLKRML